MNLNFSLTLYILISCTGASLLNLYPQNEYMYKYDGSTYLQNVGTFKVSAELSILPLDVDETLLNKRCRLSVNSYNLLINDGIRDNHPALPPEHFDFTKWLTFDLDPHGTITHVYHPPEENPQVLALKKILLGTLSSKLIISEESVKNKTRWAYKVNETGHEGIHQATYQAQTSPDGNAIIFNKTRHTKVLENANQGHTKIIDLHPVLRIPRAVAVREYFESPDESPASFQPLTFSRSEVSNRDPEYKVPKMKSHGQGELTFRGIRELGDKEYSKLLKEPNTLIKSSIEIGNIPQPRVSLAQVEADINGNLSCVQNAEQSDKKKGYLCFHYLVKLTSQLSDDDLENLTLRYLQQNELLTKQITVDLLGDLATNRSWEILVNHVILVPDPHPDLVMHAIKSFVNDRRRHSQVVLEALERIVFTKPYDFLDVDINAKVNNMASLILGAVVDYMKPYNVKWSKRISEQFQKRLGVHDPWEHRQKRSTLDEWSFKQHLNRKSIYMASLGNTQFDSSYEYIKSYLNTSDTHLLLRSSAISAIADFAQPEVATLLLEKVMDQSEDVNIRHAALSKYEFHPHGGDVRTVLAMMRGRVRRNVQEVISKIWEGFRFRLEIPGIDWQKMIGSKDLGASFGLILRNLMDLKIAPLNGHFIIDVHDKAWVTFHVGLLGFNYDLLKAELCFKGSISYNVNILKEFGFSDVLDFAELFSKHVPQIVDLIKNSIDKFRELTNTFRSKNPLDIINDLINSLLNLPKQLPKLKGIGKKIWNVLGKFTDMPPVIRKVIDLLEYINSLVHDINADITNLFDSVVDMITVHIPWAWNEISTAFSDIIKAFKNIIKDPKTAIQTIGNSVGRIAGGVIVMLEAKDEIINHKFFSMESPPWWFDIKSIVSEVFEKVKLISVDIENSYDWLQTEPDANKLALAFTGIDLRTMKNQVINEITSVVKAEFDGPLNDLLNIIEPFIKAVDIFTGIVKNIKDAWTSLTNAYKEARSLIEMVFGAKTHKDFPRKYLESESCGDGFWPTTGKGMYRERGIMAEAETGSEIVCPFNGNITRVSGNQVIIDIENVKDVEIIITNVRGRDDIEGIMVGAGEVLGFVGTPSCSDGHIHIALRKIGTEDYIDPSRYMEKRKMTLPRWEQECDRYLLVWKNKKIASGSILGGEEPQVSDETPSIPEPSQMKELIMSGIQGVIESPHLKLDGLKKLGAESFGLSDKRKDFNQVLNFRMGDVTLGSLYDIMDKAGLKEQKSNLQELVHKVQKPAFKLGLCLRPESLGTTELKEKLRSMNRADTGTRLELINRYKSPNKKCHGILNNLPNGVVCQFYDSCSGFSCCLELKLFIYRYTINAFFYYDPCTRRIVFGFNEWSKSIKEEIMQETAVIAPDNEFLESVKVSLTAWSETIEGEEQVTLDSLGVAMLKLNFQIRGNGAKFYADIDVQLCSKLGDVCLPEFNFAKGVQIDKLECSHIEENYYSKAESNEESSVTMETTSLSIRDLIRKAENLGVDSMIIHEIREQLTKTLQRMIIDKVQDALSNVFGEEFHLEDICSKGLDYKFGPFKETFWDGKLKFWVGPIPMYFSWGIGGSYGANFRLTLCAASMKATATVTPQIGSVVWGALGINLWLLKAELRLTGYILTTLFPAKAVVEFDKFPIEIRARMDVEFIPLRIELKAQLIFELKINLLFVKIHIRKVLIDVLIWHYQTPSFKANLFNLNNAEPDNTPPDFSQFSKAKEIGNRKKRALVAANQCNVKQISGRDYTEPAFQLEIGVDDDRSEVTMTYKVGTYRGGDDVASSDSMGGNSANVNRWLTSGRRLYFTITATNSQGGTAHASCELDTYDMTPPGGRIGPDYHTTSNPDVLHGSVLVIDDTPVVINEIGVGLGMGREGDQLIPWHELTDLEKSEKVDVGHDPLNIRVMEHFSAGKLGALVYTPFKITYHKSAISCARDCLSNPDLQCQSINYDYGESGSCEMLEAVENFYIEVHHRVSFHHYERKGVGHVSNLHYENVNLQHNRIYYINNLVQNKLGYESILTGKGTLFDSTPPNPGPLANIKEDMTGHEACKEFVPEHLQSRCDGETPLPNYRYIIDGPGSGTIFNGYKPLVDIIYTRSNNMVAANWDGFHENETRILIYEWGVGTEHCEDNVHPHRDPHAHLASSGDWTHTGIVHPVFMPDGFYHVTVRALNDIEYGGPMALAVCHSTPYVIDSIEPVIYSLTDITYDEETFEIGFSLYASDNMSGIKRAEIGLGTHPKNTYILDYVDVDNFTYPSYEFKIPDGIPTWVKARVTDRVDWRDINHADKPIVVDGSAPIPGVVMDGQIFGTDLMYQNSTTTYCANWKDFNDPESGISMYTVALGSSVTSSDIVEWKAISPRSYTWCNHSLYLNHSDTYYFSMIATNGGLNERNTSASSNGVYVDATEPEPGWVKDGLEPNHDLIFSSNSATVTAAIGGFSDPESDIVRLQVDVYSKHFGGSEGLIHRVHDIGVSTESIERHHFHHHHRDMIRTEVTAFNGARSSVSVTSDGYMMDLTDPLLLSLVDGLDLQTDPLYSSSLTTLSAAWTFNDPESGITKYTLSVYEFYQGLRAQIYPKSGEVVLDGTSKNWTKNDFDLRDGTMYSIKITAINGAGLAAVHETTGVTIDSTPPEMVYVHAGVLGEQTEEIIDGYVLHNDQASISASWFGKDSESGIKEFMVAIGTSRGSDNVLGFQSMGMDKSGIIKGLKLELYEKIEKFYYISVKAVNGAGQGSKMKTSSPVKIVPEDIAGYVFDGYEHNADVDNQVDTTTLTLTYSGFESAAHGIYKIEACIGTKPGQDDIIPFSSIGVISEEDGNSVMGMGGQGKLQLLGTFSASSRFYSTIRAYTGNGNILESASDGVVPDTTPPVVYISSVLGADTGNHSYLDSMFVRSNSPYSASWNVSDIDSPMSETMASIGTYPLGSDVISPFLVEQYSSFAPGLISPNLEDGKPAFMALKATNLVHLVGSSYGPATVADSSDPIEGTVTCPRYIHPQDFIFGISCSWTGFVDKESGLHKYIIGMGLAEGSDSLLTFSEISPAHNRYTFILKDLSNMSSASEVIYATIIAENKCGRQSAAFSSPIWIDHTPPVPGIVIELPDTYNTTSKESNCGDIGCNVVDAVCQRSVTQVAIAWTPFADPESQIERYSVALGSTPGGTQVSDYQSVEKGKLHLTITGLDLSMVRQVFATVRGYNGAGKYAASTSNGVWISHVSGGHQPIRPLVVWDGHEPNKDLQYQDDNTRLTANWDFEGDPCPKVKYELEFRGINGEITLPMEEIPIGQTSGMVDGLKMKDGRSYFAIVRASNLLGHVMSQHSDGVTIKLEPIVPGNVMDGDVVGADLTFWPYVDRLAANWDGFGIDRAKTLNILDNADPDIDYEIGEHQTVDFYEVAAGTDRRYPGTRTNIHPFINVGLNTSCTFNQLSLIPITAVYYITVRAHSVSGTVAEVTSNGVKVGYGAKVIKHGELKLQRFISSKHEVAFSWSDFEFAVPIQSYLWMMGLFNESTSNIHCEDLEPYVGLSELPSTLRNTFDIVPPTDVGTDTYVKMENLDLEHGKTYIILLLAIDDSGGCSHVYQAVTIDVTPPTEGEIYIGNGLHSNMATWYNPSEETVDVSWNRYSDEESDIEWMQLGIYSAQNCKSLTTNDMHLLGQTVELAPHLRNFTFFNLDLNELSVYRVTIEAMNKAGLAVVSISPPILIDLVSPTLGNVKDGGNYEKDISYQKSINTMKGTFTYFPNAKKNICTGRDALQNPSKFQSIKQNDIPSINDDLLVKQFILEPIKAAVNKDGLSLGMARDVKDPRMVGSAVSIDGDILSGGTYEFKIRTASKEFYPMTSIIFRQAEENDTFKDYFGDIRNETGEYLQKDRDFSYSTNTQDFEAGYNKPGFGFQIYSDMESSNHTLILWCLRDNETWHESVELSFDPTSTYNSYKIVVNENGVTNEESWDISMYVNSVMMTSVYGVNPIDIEDGSIVQFGVYQKRLHLLSLDDVFNPLRTASMFSSIRFPSASTDLCRFGQPFIAGHQAIVEFQAGVGTQPGLDDVKPLQTVHHPCIPCMKPCDDEVCDPTCRHNDIQLIHIKVDNLTLVPNIGVDDLGGNITVVNPYYLTVVGVTASGRRVLSSSNGIFADPTPPNITKMYHLDLSWDNSEPITYQGSNDSIAIYWEASDDESKIVDYQWAIGSGPGEVDVQDYISVGRQTYAQNTSLLGLLHDEFKYFVTIRAQNEAGLWGEAVSEGVTILLRDPDLSNVSSEIDSSAPLPDEVRGDAVQTESQDHIGVAWEEPPQEEQIEGIYVEVGTDEDKSDVFPKTQVGYNNSGKVELASDGVRINEVDVHGNLSDVRGKRVKRDLGQLLLEPGRSIQVRIKACRKGHRCSLIPTKDIIITRESDVLFVTPSNELLQVTAHNITFKAQRLQPKGKALIMGTLTIQDMEAPYHCDSSSSYSPYIINTKTTIDMTGRILLNRIKNWHGTNFYMTTIPGEPIHGGLLITVPFDVAVYPEKDKGKIIPRLLTWCPEERFWVDIARSCKNTKVNSIIDWSTGFLTVKMCDIKNACLENLNEEHRSKRSAERDGFRGPVLAALANTVKDIINTEPVLVSANKYSMYEDEGTAVIRLQASDAEDDRFIFVLDDDKSYPGLVTMSSSGFLEYTPDRDFAGSVALPIKIIEIQHSEDIEALITNTTIEIVVHPVNDNPNIYLVQKGVDVIPPSYIVDISLEENTAELVVENSINLLFMANDVDPDDKAVIKVQKGRNGSTMVSDLITVSKTAVEYCNHGSHTQTARFETLKTSMAEDNTPSKLPVPCGIPEYQLQSNLWSALSVKYTPHVGFWGVDTIKIIAEDRSFHRSELVTVNLHILHFACKNGAMCEGPHSDPQCKLNARTNGFTSEGYQCACPPGFTGTYCQDQINECNSDPCPANFTCVDGILSYTCICKDNAWPCANDTKLLIIILPIVYIFLILVVLVIVWKLKGRKGKKLVNPTDSYDAQDENVEAINMKPIRVKRRIQQRKMNKTPYDYEYVKRAVRYVSNNYYDTRRMNDGEL